MTVSVKLTVSGVHYIQIQILWAADDFKVIAQIVLFFVVLLYMQET